MIVVLDLVIVVRSIGVMLDIVILTANDGKEFVRLQSVHLDGVVVKISGQFFVSGFSISLLDSCSFFCFSSFLARYRFAGKRSVFNSSITAYSFP